MVKNKIIPRAIKDGYNLFKLKVAITDSEKGDVLGLTYEKENYPWREAKGGEFSLFRERTYPQGEEDIKKFFDLLGIAV